MVILSFLMGFSNTNLEMSSLVSGVLHPRLLLFSEESMKDVESLYAK